MTAVAAAAAVRGVPGAVRIPKTHTSLCTANVLVMERLDGRALGAINPDEQIGDRQALARTLFDTLLGEVMIDGIFHADPHPGNVLLLADGQLGLLDFGSVGRIDAGLRSALQRLLLAVDRGDPAALHDAHLAEQLSPAALRKSATDELISLVPMLRRLPRRLDRITGSLEHGRLGLNIRLLADQSDRLALNSGLSCSHRRHAGAPRTLPRVEGSTRLSGRPRLAHLWNPSGLV